MESAFGVDHGISKSYMGPGKGYKAASKLSAAERKDVKGNVELNGFLRSIAPKSPMQNRPSSKGRKVMQGTTLPKGRKVTTKVENMGPGQHGSSIWNGRGGGEIKISPKAPANTDKHEMAHVSPKRNPHRALMRFKDPVKRGREEGRADFIAEGKRTPGVYRGSKEFESGYNEVQGRMSNARSSRKR